MKDFLELFIFFGYVQDYCGLFYRTQLNIASFFLTAKHAEKKTKGSKEKMIIDKEQTG